MDLAVQHDEKAGKYYAVVDGVESVCEYREYRENREDRASGARTLDFCHTYVPPALRGRGIADELVRQALDDVLAKSYKVIPSCWFVRAYIQRHPKYQPLVA